jgi:pyruvate/2-oxoglutarate dehydrogenase complex dihydrolipoamide dehydrogenase (E3) component
MRTHSNSYDVVVVGAGIAGETCARRVRRGGLRVALIEGTTLGGEAAAWAAIPSTRLLGPANPGWQAQVASGVTAPEVTWPHGRPSRDDVTLQDTEERRISRLEREGVVVLRGAAHLAGPGRIDVHGDREQLLEAKFVVVATGSTQRPPEIAGLEEAGYWTSHEASRAAAQPASLLVLDLDGGTRAIEMAQVFRLYGSDVTLIARTDRLAPHEDPEAGEVLARHLERRGIRLILGRRPVRAERGEDGTRRVTLDDGSQVRAEGVLVAGSRLPNVRGLGLERIGTRVDDAGVQVDEFCRAGDGIWAVGDVTAIGSRTHVALYQARLAADDILGRGHPAHYASVPRVIYTDPQVAATGLTLAEVQAQARRVDVASATLELAVEGHPLATGTAADRVSGRLTLHADRARRVLIGAWAVAPDAGEWIQLAALAIRAAVPLDTLHDTVEQFPPFSEGYLQALDHLL